MTSASKVFCVMSHSSNVQYFFHSYCLNYSSFKQIFDIWTYFLILKYRQFQIMYGNVVLIELSTEDVEKSCGNAEKRVDARDPHVNAFSSWLGKSYPHPLAAKSGCRWCFNRVIVIFVLQTALYSGAKRTVVFSFQLYSTYTFFEVRKSWIFRSIVRSLSKNWKAVPALSLPHIPHTQYLKVEEKWTFPVSLRLSERTNQKEKEKELSLQSLTHSLLPVPCCPLLYSTEL